MKKIFLTIAAAMLATGAFAQIDIFGKVKDKVNQKANEKTDEAIDKGINKTEDNAKKSGKKKDKDNNESQEKDDNTSSDKSIKSSDQPTMAQYGKYDFVPGEKIIFEDAVEGETLGEFPSKWNLGNGKIEIASLKGQQVIAFLEGNYANIYPLWVDKSDYLPEVFSIEFDFYCKREGYYNMELNLRGTEAGAEFADHDEFSEWITTGSSARVGKAAGNAPDLGPDYYEKWHHIALSFNKGNVKIYSDQNRLCNMPRLNGNPHSLTIGCIGSPEGTQYIKNIRIAAGGGELYKRVVSDGKFVTHGILFDVNKATIKPNSMGAINEIYSLMKDHADLKFEIDGHTDSDGDDKTNMKLSQDRADAVKAQLVSMGIDASRMTTKGLGESKPVADNTSPEGKANNRRVEFIKM